MAKQLNLFKGALGINNKIDPVRVKYNPETGVQELASAVNVDIDSTGRISRRKGYTLKLALASHSLFSCGNYCLFVSGDALRVLEPNYTSNPIRNVTRGAKVSYVKIKDDTYYANGYQKGIVRDKVSYTWKAFTTSQAVDYVGPTTTKTFSDPPIGHLLELFNGAMLIAQDNVLWYSEPFAYAWYDLKGNYLEFSDRITMVKAVQGGVFVSTERETFFHKGTNVKELQQMKVADYPAIEGTMAQVDATRIGDGNLIGTGAIWASTEGICFGGFDGYFRNLTQRKLTYPAARYGAGLYKDGKYICLLKP